ncbi:hypothetical protein [Bacillus tianshenii]|uniref:hypothetical protein n=1 Tax=Sutcliffiella tianshenii TaxID=1463404 RepID=UPI00384EE9E3
MKKTAFIMLLAGILLVFGACSKSTESGGQASVDKQEVSKEKEPPKKETESEDVRETPSNETEAITPTFYMGKYLNENYPMDNVHYVPEKWENENTGRTEYTVKIIPDTKEYSDEMDEKFKNGHGKVYEEIEALSEMAKKIMEELPQVEKEIHIDSVSWVSYDGEFSVLLIQDFENSDLKTDNKGDLSGYTAKQIEYARVWLLLGPNQELDELNARLIPAGTPINPNDDTSALYPEDVIQLAGSRLVDGSVTYSGNGDGTINVYNVPLRWETNLPKDLPENYMQKLTEEIIETTELVYVDPGDNEKIIELIKLLKVH